MYIVTAGCKSMGICKTAVTDERNVCVGGGGALDVCILAKLALVFTVNLYN